MQVKGNHTFEVEKEKLWAYLMDPVVLAKITPGVSRLETLEEDKYKTVSDIKIGPVKGSFKGKLDVIEKDEPNSFAIKMHQESKIGNAQAKIQMILEDAGDGKSILSFDGKANLSGVIARTGQRVLSGVANTITKEVFASLEEHIASEASPSMESKEEGAITKETSSTSSEPPVLAEQTKGPEVAEETTNGGGFFAWLSTLLKKLFN